MVLSASRSVSLASNLLARPVCCLGVKIGAELLLTALIPPSLCYSYLRRLNQSFAAGPGGARHIFHPEQKRSRHSLSFWLCTGAQCSPALTSRIYWSKCWTFFSLCPFRCFELSVLSSSASHFQLLLNWTWRIETMCENNSSSVCFMFLDKISSVLHLSSRIHYSVQPHPTIVIQKLISRHKIEKKYSQ